MSKFIYVFNIFTQQMNQSDLLSRKINCVLSSRAASVAIGPTGPIGYGIGVTLNGTWNPLSSYVGTTIAAPGTHIDAVTYNGSLYVCIANINGNANNQPPNLNATNWQLYVASGTRIYSGVGPPATNFGAVGDFYIDTDTGIMYGPKA
jgi:hypothetical protein